MPSPNSSICLQSAPATFVAKVARPPPALRQRCDARAPAGGVVGCEHFQLEGSILAWHQMIKRDSMVFATSARQQKMSNNLSQINQSTSNACKKHTSVWQTEYLKYQTSKTLLHIFSHLLRNAGCLNPHDQTRLRQGTQDLGEASAEGPPFRLHWDHRYRHTPWHYDSSTSWGVWIAS